MKSRLLVLRRFADDLQGVLAAIYWLALVCFKLFFDFQLWQRLVGCKLDIAAFADSTIGAGCVLTILKRRLGMNAV